MFWISNILGYLNSSKKLNIMLRIFSDLRDMSAFYIYVFSRNILAQLDAVYSTGNAQESAANGKAKRKVILLSLIHI